MPAGGPPTPAGGPGVPQGGPAIPAAGPAAGGAPNGQPSPAPVGAAQPVSFGPGPGAPPPPERVGGPLATLQPAAEQEPPTPNGKSSGIADFLTVRRLIAAAIALLCVAAGAVGSVLGAHAVARNDAAKARRASEQSAASVASTAKLVLEREQELGISGATFFAGNSKATRAEFAKWEKWAQTLRRNPELEQLGLVTLVRAPELPAFEAALAGRKAPRKPSTRTATSGAATTADSPVATTGTSATATAGSATSTGATTVSGSGTEATVADRPARHTLSIRPAGARPYYCLALANLARNAHESPAPGLDYCAGRTGLLHSRDSSSNYYVSVSAGGAGALEVFMPVYKGNQPPVSLAARMGAFAGWLREVVVPNVIVEQALQGRGGDAVRMVFHSHTASATFGGGTPQAGAPDAVAELHGGWTIEGFGTTVTTGVSHDGGALALLIAGCVLSILLGLLVFVLGESEPPAMVSVPAAQEEPGEDLHDPLTGLPNRALMLDRAECMLARAGRQSGLLVGALFIDVDWFADVNERLGREAGDEILKIVAQRLDTVVRAGDTVGRLGGDEFVLLVETAARGARLDSLARRVVEALHKPFELEGFGPSFYLTASIGVAFGRYATPDDLLRDAQLALNAAKAAGKDRYTLFNANMRSVIEGRGVLEAELNTALAEKQFFLLYEPIYDLGTGQVAGLEAMVRWLHPKQGVLSPGDFLALAEETGLSVPIGRWILEEACARAAAWAVAGYPIGVSMKVTPNQLNREGFVTDVRRALQQSGIEPSLLTLEIAETTLMRDVTEAVERLQEIKGLGLRIAIDDFGGSGYAYHSDLRRLPLDFLKVDRGSLAASEDEDYRTWLLEAIMIVGRDLSLTVIAKGIESLEQLSALQTMGCTMAQGTLLGKPVPATNIEAVLVSRLPVVRADAPGAPDA
jgi:diguanylate cyclase (GGDEF)-like protein